MELSTQTAKKIIFIASVIIIIYTALENISYIAEAAKHIFTIFLPITAGFCIAFVLNIPMTFFEQRLDALPNQGPFLSLRRHKRGLSIVLTLLLIVLVLYLICLIILPQLYKTLNSIAAVLPSFSQRVLLEIKNALNEKNVPVDKITSFELNWNNLFSFICETILNGSNSFLNTATEITASVLSTVFNFILAVIIAVYTLLKKEKIGSKIIEIMTAFLPERLNKYILKAASISFASFSNFISGQLLEAVILGFLCFFGMLILRIPYISVIPVIISVTALIPIFGAWLGGGLSTFLILTQSPAKAVIFIVFILLLQQLEGNLIYPKIVGKSIGLPSLLVIFAVIVGGSAFGVWGIIFSVPITSVLYTMINEETKKRLNRE